MKHTKIIMDGQLIRRLNRRSQAQEVTISKLHKCDLCLESFLHEPIKVYDENHKLQKGVVSCGCHIEI